MIHTAPGTSTLGNQKQFKAAVRRAHKGQSCSPTAWPQIKLSMRKQQHAWQNQSSELVIKVACQDTSECPFFYISVFICAIFLRGFIGQPSLLCQPEKAFEYNVWEACLLLALKSTACDLRRVREHMAFLPLAGQCFLLFTSWAHVKVWNVCSSTWVFHTWSFSLSLRHVFSFAPPQPFSRIQPLIFTPSLAFAREQSGATPPPFPLAQCWWTDSHGWDPTLCYDPLRST